MKRSKKKMLMRAAHETGSADENARVVGGVYGSGADGTPVRLTGEEAREALEWFRELEREEEEDDD